MSILRADSIRDRAGTGAPDFPNGLTGTLTGNVTGTATTATTLSGTPNISVGTLGCGNVTSTGDVTGVNATFSGNLTVQGTTTTIDTAITEVDSLNVEGSVGIGTTNPTTLLEVGNQNSSAAATVTISRGEDITGGTGPNIDLKHGPASGTQRTHEIYSFQGDLRIAADSNENMEFHTGGSESLRITSGGTAIFKKGLVEKNVNGTTLAAASNNIALSSGNVHRFTGNESGAKTVNFTGVHSTLANGESVSFTVILTPNNSGYINAATVDGATPGTPTKWSGGSAPSSGSNGGRDVYTFTIFKYGTATTDYEVYGAVTNYG